MIKECIRYKNEIDAETDFIYKVYKDHKISAILNECFKDTHSKKV